MKNPVLFFRNVEVARGVRPWKLALRLFQYLGLFSATILYGANLHAEKTGDYFEPSGILLTWQQDPTTTMTIDWHTEPGKHETRPPSILYRKTGTDDEWKDVAGTMHAFPFTARTVNRVELTGLEPGTYYSFRIGPAPDNRFPFTESRTYQFRTMPASLEQRPLLGAFGGDTGANRNTRRILGELVKHDIDFLVIGGDLSYADGGGRDWRGGEHSHPGRSKEWWERWFDIMTEYMTTENGRVIPVIAGIGNHEVWAGYYTNHPGYEQTDAWRERLAPLYYNLFAFPGQPGYATLDFSDYMSIILLDTDHTNPVEGQQSEWLEQVLSERTGVPHVFPVYHVGGYPSITARDYDGATQKAIREVWHPLFEQYGINIVFENHDHTYKRTQPILSGGIDPDGIVYIGDGALGMGSLVNERLISADDAWYLKKSTTGWHFILVELTPESRQLTMINEEGEIIDTFPETGWP